MKGRDAIAMMELGQRAGAPVPDGPAPGTTAGLTGTPEGGVTPVGRRRRRRAGPRRRASHLARPGPAILALPGEAVALLRRFLADEGPLLASALAFAFVLCVAPLALILLSIAGFLLHSDEVAEYVFDAATLLLPAYGSELAELLQLLAKERAVSGVVGALALAVFASQLFALTRAVVNRAFRVRQRRRFLHGLLFDLFVVALLGTLAVGFAGAMALAALGELALGALPPPFTVAVRLRRLFSMPVLSALAVGLLFVVYRTFPNTRVPARAAAIATVAVAPLWELARRIFTAYVSGVGVYGMLYGSLGIGVAALVWIYVSATIFVLGAELAAVVTERSAGPAPSAPTAGSHGWTEGTHRVGERAPQDGTS